MLSKTTILSKEKRKEPPSKRLKNRSKTNMDQTFSNEEKNILLLEISVAEALINTLCLFKT